MRFHFSIGLLLLCACTAPFAGGETTGRRTAGHESDSREEPDEPGNARAWRRLRWRDENGRIPASGLHNALLQRKSNLAQLSAVDDAGVAPSGWVEHGPNNVGGRTRSLLIHPTQHNLMWAGSVGGGVWHSKDSGATWNPTDDWLSRLPIGCLTMHPTDPKILFAGTGEGYYNGDSLGGDGLYKSVDGGTSWTRLQATANWEYVNRIAIDKNNPQLMLASVRPGGIQRSVDGGNSWTQVHAASGGSFQVMFDPNDSKNLVAHAMEGTRHAGPTWHRVVYSTDAGLTWSAASTGLSKKTGFSARIELAYAASQPGMVYASCGTNNGECWRSVDGGKNWTLRKSSYGNSFGWYYNTIWVDPTDSNLVVVGSDYFRRSTNGGSSFSRISAGYIITNQPHPDAHKVVPHPGYNGTSNRRVYVTTDGGVYTSSDIRSASRNGSGTWSRLDRNYRTSQFYGASGDGPTGRITGGLQDNGTLTLQKGSTQAALTFGGDGGFSAIDWSNPNYIYGEYVRLKIHRSTNAGSSASYIYQGISDAGSQANFIAPFILDPNDPRRMLAGGASLWRSNNVNSGSPSWSRIKPANASFISAIAVAKGNANAIWVGHSDGQIYSTINGLSANPTWTAIDDNSTNNPIPDRYITRLLVDADDHKTVYVTLGGFTADNLWRTQTSGTSWTALNGAGLNTLPQVPINGIARHPRLRDHLYVGTEVGVYASADNGQHWSSSNEGPANVSVDEIVFMHNSERLLIATHGRGLFTCEVRAPEYSSFGTGCAGSKGVPSLEVDSTEPPRIGRSFGLKLSKLAPAQSAYLFFGVSRTQWSGFALPYDLSGLGMTSCYANTSGELIASLGTGSGSTTYSFTVPQDPQLLGNQFYSSCWVTDPAANQAGMVTSNGVACTIGQ